MPSRVFSRSAVSVRVAMVLAVAVIGTAFVGCHGPVKDPDYGPKQTPLPPTTSGGTVATVNGLTITRADLDGALYEGFGLAMLFDLAELDLARQLLDRDHLILTADDIERERTKVLTGLLGPDRVNWDSLFNQFLHQKNLTRTEFDIRIVQTRACLRKWIEPQMKGKFSELAIRRAFDQDYGALRRIQDIQLPDLPSVGIARDRLGRNEPFEQVAKSMSLDALTRDNGGSWEPFSNNDERIPRVLRQAAFGLDVGKISENLQVGETYHLIRVTEEISPKLYKYEDYRDAEKTMLEQRYTDEAVRFKQNELQSAARKLIHIDDPILEKQFAAVLDGEKLSSMDRPEVSKRIGAQPLTTMPTTSPAASVRTGFPATEPTTVPTSAPAKPVSGSTTKP